MEMRQLPGVTNIVPFRSKYSSRLRTLINLKQMMTRMQGGVLLPQAAEAETRRQIMVAAIALERFHLKHGVYPKTIQELAPDFLKSTPTDFIDGQPLRYRPGPDGHFVLYSIGLDGLDNGGVLKRSPEMRAYSESILHATVLEQTDLVWPRPASDAEVKVLRAADQRAARKGSRWPNSGQERRQKRVK